MYLGVRVTLRACCTNRLTRGARVDALVKYGTNTEILRRVNPVSTAWAALPPQHVFAKGYQGRLRGW